MVVDEVVEVVLAASGAPGEPQAAPRSARAQAAGPRRAARPAGPARRVRGRPAPDAPPGAAGGRWVSRTRAPYSGRPWPRAQVRAPHALHSGTNPMAAPDSSVAGPEHRRGERPMGRLYAALFFLLVVFSAAMALITAGVYVSVWWLSVLGVGDPGGLRGSGRHAGAAGPQGGRRPRHQDGHGRHGCLRGTAGPGVLHHGHGVLGGRQPHPLPEQRLPGARACSSSWAWSGVSRAASAAWSCSPTSATARWWRTPRPRRHSRRTR